MAGEIAHGLSRRDAITIIPVRVGEASFPLVGDLPPRIRGLLDHNARTLHDTRAEDFDQGMAELIDQIGPIGQRILGIPRIQFAIGSFVLAASAAAFAAVALQPPGRMGGETFNIAVAEFRTVAGSGKVISSPLAHRFTRAVAKELSASKQALSGDAQFWNGSAGAVEGSTPDERTQSAIDLADRRGADLLVYGDLRQADGLVTIEAPSLLISNRLSVELRDLIAHVFVAQPAPTPFLATEDPARMASSMAQQSASLARLLAGLKQFQAGHYAGAAAVVKPLTSAAKEPGWAAGLAANPTREALVSYVLAYGAMFLTSPSAQGYDQAGKLFDDALRADPSFDRALLGKANITYLQTIANGGCSPRGAGGAVIDEALRSAIGVASATSPLGASRMRGAFLAGTIAFCEAYSLDPDHRDPSTPEAAAGSSGAQAARAALYAEPRRWFQVVLDASKPSDDFYVLFTPSTGDWARQVLGNPPSRDADAALFAANAHLQRAWMIATVEYAFPEAAKEMRAGETLMAEAQTAKVVTAIGIRSGVRVTGTAAFQEDRECIEAWGSLDTKYQAAHPRAAASELLAFRRQLVKTCFPSPSR